MRPLTIALVLLFGLPQASAQTVQEAPSGIAQDAMAGKISCNDPRILSLPSNNAAPGVSQTDYNFIYCVALRVIKANRVTLPAGFGSSWQFTAIHNAAINSQTQPLPNGQLAVLAFDSMAQFLNYDPDEEAFIIGHEIGHVQDWENCAALKVARMNRAPILKQLALTGARQACEENADNYGLQYMWGAGYNPFAAGALFGRLEMYAPNETRGMASMLNNFLSDHPISSERIRKLRAVVAHLCSQQGTVCRP